MDRSFTEGSRTIAPEPPTPSNGALNSTPSATPRGTMKAESLRSGSPMFPRPAPTQGSIPAHPGHSHSNDNTRSTSAMPKVLETVTAGTTRNSMTRDVATWQTGAPTKEFEFRADKQAHGKAGKVSKRKKRNWCSCFGSVDSDSEQEERENRHTNIMQAPSAKRLMGLDVSKETEEMRKREQEQERMRRSLEPGGSNQRMISPVGEQHRSPLVEHLEHTRPSSALDGGVQFSFKESSLGGSGKQLQMERATHPADLSSELRPPPHLGSPPTSPPAPPPPNPHQTPPPSATPHAPDGDRKPLPDRKSLNRSAVKPYYPAIPSASDDRVGSGNRCTGPSLDVPRLDGGGVMSKGVARTRELDLSQMEGEEKEGGATDGGEHGAEAEGVVPQSSPLMLGKDNSNVMAGAQNQTLNSTLNQSILCPSESRSPRNLSLSPLSICPQGDLDSAVDSGAGQPEEQGGERKELEVGAGAGAGSGGSEGGVLFDEEVMQIYDEDLITTVSAAPVTAKHNSPASPTHNATVAISDEDMLWGGWRPGYKDTQAGQGASGLAVGPGIGGPERNLNLVSQRRGGAQPPRSGSLLRIFS